MPITPKREQALLIAQDICRLASHIYRDTYNAVYCWVRRPSLLETIDSLEKRCDRYNRQTESLNDGLTKAEAWNARLGERLKVIDKYNEDLSEEIVRIEHERLAALDSVDARDAEIFSLKKKIAGLTSARNRFRRERDALKAKLNEEG